VSEFPDLVVRDWKANDGSRLSGDLLGTFCVEMAPGIIVGPLSLMQEYNKIDGMPVHWLSMFPLGDVYRGYDPLDESAVRFRSIELINGFEGAAIKAILQFLAGADA
jgi:hypothetical protein